MTSSFWTAAVLPEKPCKIIVPSDTVCNITNIALDQDAEYPTEGRVVLYASVNNGRPIAIVPFTLGRFESTIVNLQFENEDIIEFTIKGTQIPIHVSGTLDGAIALNIDNGAPQETEEEEKAEDAKKE